MLLELVLVKQSFENAARRIFNSNLLVKVDKFDSIGD
jgi:hypothetical protein